jgi:signal peptidase I
VSIRDEFDNLLSSVAGSYIESMVKVYRETSVETLILILVGGGLVFIPLYFNMYTVSLNVLGVDSDLEASVVGTSMVPTLKVGDLLYVKQTNVSLIKAAPSSGDIIVFHRPNWQNLQYPMVVSHRAINKTLRNGMTYFETKGDNCDNPDQWVDSRGENYTWNGMISELLLIGRVVGVTKNYATVFPVGVMALFLAGTVMADAILSAFLISRNPKLTSS